MLRSSESQNALLIDLLRQTSRSFYLTLRVLPAAVRHQIGLAYLLARTTDTIADTEIVPLTQRLKALHALRARILGTNGAPLKFGELARAQAAPAERALLENCEAGLAALRELSPGDLQLTREVLDTIMSGQELDLQRFGAIVKPPEGGTPNIIQALRTDAEMDDYTYRVAGCVGEFWTKMCRAHLFQTARWDDSFLLSNGIRFGKGLQLVNILRDLPDDLRKGRCYLPAERLSAVGLDTGDLLQPANEPKFRPLYDNYLATAAAHLAAGWDYTNALPRRCARVRLACVWPILIGMKTLARLRNGNVLDPQQRIKITRPEVKALILRSVLYYPWPSAWKRLFPGAIH